MSRRECTWKVHDVGRKPGGTWLHVKPTKGKMQSQRIQPYPGTVELLDVLDYFFCVQRKRQMIGETRVSQR